MPPEDKDAALLPRRINGRWALASACTRLCGYKSEHLVIIFTRPQTLGDHCVVLEARRGAWWDANKIGLSPQPIETPEGWLIIYHGVRNTPGGCLYRLGLALLDLEQPCHVIRRGDEWIFDRISPMSAWVMLAMWSSHVGSFMTRRAARYACTMVRRIPAWHWPLAPSMTCLTGSRTPHAISSAAHRNCPPVWRG